MLENTPKINRWQDKHAHILNAATSVFAQSGFQNTSMDDIAEFAGVSKITIYKHFHNKDFLFRTVMKPLLSLMDNFPFSSISTSDPLPQQIFFILKSWITLLLSPSALKPCQQLFKTDALFKDLKQTLWHHCNQPMDNLMVEMIGSHTPSFPNAELTAKLLMSAVREQIILPAWFQFKEPLMEGEIDPCLKEILSFLNASEKLHSHFPHPKSSLKEPLFF